MLKTSSLWRKKNKGIRRRKDLQGSWIDKINVAKMAIKPKDNLQIQQNPHQNSKTFIYRSWKYNSQFHVEKQKQNKQQQKPTTMKTRQK